MRIGFGYDSHRFEVCASGSSEPSLSQKLGGVFVPECPKLKGHSDADVLIHAVIDALLGATALGDIGSHFPDTDPRWKDADSAKLLVAVMDEIAQAGYSVGNVDVTLICERPKLRPHVDPISSVSVKGKTNEGMDATGEGVGIAVHAVALVESSEG